MKNILFSAILISAALATACHKKNDDPTVVTTNSATIKYQECITFQNQQLTICFEDANEYRCPCNVDCVWEGACDVSLKVTGTGIDTLVHLSYNTSGSGVFPDSAAIGTTVIRVTGLVPTDCNDYEDYEKYKVDISLE